MDILDLRSDTVTQPSREMRRAIAEAELGDDVFGEDPTVNRLQEVAAERLGKDEALFVSSGTMGNLIGLLVNGQRGNEVITEAQSHVLLYEAGGAAAIGGLQFRTVNTDRGIFTSDDVAQLVWGTEDVHNPPTAAIAVENTHNRQGGSVWPLEALESVALSAMKYGLSVHMDGARIFNASVALGVDVKEIAKWATTVTFCFSKGLGCPAGAMLCGPHDKITAARRWRKMLGGGMRQAGILAAAGLYALDAMVERLGEDHANARRLSEALARLPGLRCDLDRVQTNIVFVDAATPTVGRLREACRSKGVLLGGDDRRLRLVTHFGVGAEDIDRAVEVIEKSLRVVCLANSPTH
jgi:threonine aldolase